MKRSNVQKKEIVDCIAGENNLRANLVLNVVNAFLNKVLDFLAKGNRLEFRDFGVFQVVKRKAKVGRNPKKAKVAIKIPAKKVVKFTPGSKLKKIVAQEFGV
jgi:integration host factor subunit beta